jgi:5-methylthioadenosine/S-adenosylhomocysteine deaminase
MTPGRQALITRSDLSRRVRRRTSLCLRADNLSIWPLNNACVAAVNLMSAGHIEGVFVAGKVKKWQGRLLGIDRNIVLREVARLRDNVLQKAQFSIGLTA